MKKTVAITGGSGFIGAYLVKRMAQDGWNVKVVDSMFRGSLSRLSNLKDEIEIFETDIRNEKELSKISHNRTFNFVYAANDEYINVLKNLKNYPPAPLDNFINHGTDFISNLPEEKIDEIQKKIKENIIN